jgi:hypothetical protein
MSKYDWTLIRQEYIAGIVDETGKHVFPTLASLARKYAVSSGSLALRCRVEKWKAKRQSFWKDIADELEQRERQRHLERIKEFDDVCFDGALAGAKQIKDHLNTAEIASELTQQVVATPPSDLDKLSRSLVSFQKVGRLVVGEATEHTAIDGIEFIPVK